MGRNQNEKFESEVREGESRERKQIEITGRKIIVRKWIEEIKRESTVKNWKVERESGMRK